MHDFDLFEDLMLFKNEESVFGLCFSASYCFERLTRQLDKWQLNRLLTHWFVGKDSEHNQNIVVWTIRNFDCMRFLQDMLRTIHYWQGIYHVSLLMRMRKLDGI